MKLLFHGGAKEVGKSCIEVQTNGKRFVLDAGLKFKENGFESPDTLLNVAQIDGLFLSHAHLDHTGALPLFVHANMTCPIFATEQTKDIMQILLKDSYKIARIRHLHPAYEKLDLKKVTSAVKVVEFNKPYNIDGIEYKFFNAGHIPGSAMILIKTEGKRLLYTGDFKYNTAELMRGADFDLDKNLSELKNVDVLICESTYGGKPLPDRSQIEEEFLDKIEQVIKKGSVVIPVFALGRAQEVLLLLSRKKWTVPIYLDGMCVDVTKTILKDSPAYLNKRQLLHDMFRKVNIVKKETQRLKIMSNQGIFITTSGMLQGGPVMAYIENMWGNPNNAILMTGFQCKRTNGRLLLEEGFVYLNGWKTYVKCQVQKFDFSGHSDDAELKAFITKISPKNLIVDHGDEQCGMSLKYWAERNLKIPCFAPAVGEMLEF